MHISYSAPSCPFVSCPRLQSSNMTMLGAYIWIGVDISGPSSFVKNNISADRLFGRILHQNCAHDLNLRIPQGTETPGRPRKIRLPQIPGRLGAAVRPRLPPCQASCRKHALEAELSFIPLPYSDEISLKSYLHCLLIARMQLQYCITQHPILIP